MVTKLILPLVVGILLSSCLVGGKTSTRISSGPAVQQTTIAKPDTLKKPIKPYKELITDKAITQKGLFKVHKIEERYFFEIGDIYLNMDILIVNRVSKGNYSWRSSLYAGDWIGERVIQFFKGPANKLYIRQMSYQVRSEDSTNNGIYNALQNSNMLPIIASFDIKTISSDSSATVIDITDFITTDNELFSLNSQLKSAYGYGAYQADKSFIQSVTAYSSNMEITAIKTYLKGTVPATLELSSSIILLPKVPMTPRFADKRVGYFTSGYYDYDASTSVKYKEYIKRWRLEPKDEDIEKYKRGELVSPKKPIIYYIDPATPKKWVPYLIQGVNDWQQAFEAAGFKDAIYALEAPVEDSSWSLENANYNAIVYKASEILNASGPHVSDPRSGEILETHINWYHNIQQLMHDWYMVQAGPNDPAARKNVFDDSLMGKLIRYVCAHEVGHTLGLQHNFGASSTIPVDSMRSKHYVDANGYCPSIMDYARFNYVAQPEDEFRQDELIPRIGIYDKWAIEWGYKWLPEKKTQDEEKSIMNKWIISRLEKDKRLWFGGYPYDANVHSFMFDFESRRRSEDIGDDPNKAGQYGIANLKRIIPHLIEWTKVPNENYALLERVYQNVLAQYERYLYHSAANIGGFMWTEKFEGQKGDKLTFPNRSQQMASVQFLQNEFFEPPLWILNNKINKLIVKDDLNSPDALGWYKNLAFDVLRKTISFFTYNNLLLAQNSNPNEAYTIEEFLKDMENGIWGELAVRAPIGIFRRTLQKLYIDRITNQLFSNPQDIKGFYDKPMADLVITSDIRPILKEYAKSLLGKIDKAIPQYKDKLSQLHLLEIRDRLSKALSNSALDRSSFATNSSTSSAVGGEGETRNESKNKLQEECWTQD